MEAGAQIDSAVDPLAVTNQKGHEITSKIPIVGQVQVEGPLREFVFRLRKLNPREISELFPCGLLIRGCDEGTGEKTITRLIKNPEKSSPKICVLSLRPEQLTYEILLSIGRGEKNDITILSKKISKSHAHMLYTNSHWKLVDDSSTNGTFLNGEKLKPGVSYTLIGIEEIKFGRALPLVFLETAELIELL